MSKNKSMFCLFKDDKTAVNQNQSKEELIKELNVSSKSSQCKSKLPVSIANWDECFSPRNSEELAIHAKKLQELQNWLQHCGEVHAKTPAQICLLTGPSGIGKTAAVRVLAKENNFDLQEWINPVDQEVVTTLGDQDGVTYVGSQVKAFKSFLLRASRYKSLLTNNDKRLVLVEDFPNALLNDPVTFDDILSEYTSYGKSPIIFIVTDSKSRSLNINYKLFPDPTKEKFQITHITFNLIAATLMQKAMKRFCAIMTQSQYANTYAVPSASVLDSIVMSAQGDIRNALLNLHFGSLKGAPDLLTKQLQSEEEANNKKSKKKKAPTALKSIGRDESITMLHALGRVFNPKFTNERKFVHAPEDIAEAFCIEPKKFVDFVHGNYVPHFANMEHLVDAADSLSLADVMLTEYREDAMSLTALTVAVRSVMVTNLTPVAGWMPVRSLKRSNVQDVPSYILSSGERISRRLYVSEYSSYVKQIGAIVTKSQ